MDEVIEEYLDEEMLDAPQTIQFQSIKMEEKPNIVRNLDFNENRVNEPKQVQKIIVKSVKTVKHQKIEKFEQPQRVGQVIKLYAYKDCLGKFNSLANNPDIPLWFRDNSFLLQKYMRQKFDDEGLYYYSTNVYSCWLEERADEYLELEAVVTVKKISNFIVKILKLEEIENICVLGDFKSLGLQPYVNYLNHPQYPYLKDEQEDAPITVFAQEGEAETF